MNVEEKIRSCPFCGEIPTYRVGPEHSYIGGQTQDAILDCCIEMRVPFGEDYQLFEENERTEERAQEILVKKWNSRIY